MDRAAVLDLCGVIAGTVRSATLRVECFVVLAEAYHEARKLVERDVALELALRAAILTRSPASECQFVFESARDLGVELRPLDVPRGPRLRHRRWRPCRSCGPVCPALRRWELFDRFDEAAARNDVEAYLRTVRQLKYCEDVVFMPSRHIAPMIRAGESSYAAAREIVASLTWHPDYDAMIDDFVEWHIGRGEIAEASQYVKAFSADDARRWSVMSSLCKDGRVLPDRPETEELICLVTRG